MRPWTSLALLAVVLIKWISGAHGRQFCVQPENLPLCQILMEHRFAINKRFLRFGRNFGEPFLRFGRGGTEGVDDEDFRRKLSSFEDKAYLRFGRTPPTDEQLAAIFIRGPSNYKGWQYRRKRDAEQVATDTVHSRHRRAAEVTSAGQADFMKRADDTESTSNMVAKRQTYFPRFGRPDHAEVVKEENGDFDKRPDRLSRSGWLHFGKRILAF